MAEDDGSVAGDPWGLNAARSRRSRKGVPVYVFNPNLILIACTETSKIFASSGTSWPEFKTYRSKSDRGIKISAACRFAWASIELESPLRYNASSKIPSPIFGSCKT